MASEERAKGPASLDALFKNKAKKKPKPTNMNAVQEKEKPPPEKPLSKLLLKPPAEPAAEGEQGWERALRRDQELLKAGGLWIKEVEADGACLFRAFADQLGGDGGKSHSDFRERCVDFMQAHREDFEPFLEEDFSAYCERMRQPSTWGGHVEAQALARCEGVNALIYRPAEASGQLEGLMTSLVEIPTSDESARCVQLSFHPTHHHGQHYNSVRCCEDEGAGPVPAVSLLELRRRLEEAAKPKAPAPVEEGPGFAAGKPTKKVFF